MFLRSAIYFYIEISASVPFRFDADPYLVSESILWKNGSGS